MISKINGLSIANNYSKNNNKSNQLMSFLGKMVIKSKSLDIEDEEKFTQVVNNIYNGLFVRNLGIFPEFNHTKIDGFSAFKIHFDNKYDNKVKELINKLNDGINTAKVEDKIEIKYEEHF